MQTLLVKFYLLPHTHCTHLHSHSYKKPNCRFYDFTVSSLENNAKSFLHAAHPCLRHIYIYPSLHTWMNRTINLKVQFRIDIMAMHSLNTCVANSKWRKSFVNTLWSNFCFYSIINHVQSVPEWLTLHFLSSPKFLTFPDCQSLKPY